MLQKNLGCYSDIGVGAREMKCDMAFDCWAEHVRLNHNIYLT